MAFTHRQFGNDGKEGRRSWITSSDPRGHWMRPSVAPKLTETKALDPRTLQTVAHHRCAMPHASSLPGEGSGSHQLALLPQHTMASPGVATALHNPESSGGRRLPECGPDSGASPVRVPRPYEHRRRHEEHGYRLKCAVSAPPYPVTIWREGRQYTLLP